MTYWASNNPAYAATVDAYEMGRFDNIFNKLRRQKMVSPSMTLVNCTNCGGVGRTIMVDGEGKQYSVTCQSCGGAGQKDNGDGQ